MTTPRLRWLSDELRDLQEQFRRLQFPPAFVYLAGPIQGCTYGEANDWRKAVAAKLAPHNIIAISPLRCEPLRGERYDAGSPDPRFGTARAISAKNRLDVRRCDLTLAVLPSPRSKPQSYGTMGEAHWGDAYGKPIILCTDDPYVSEHPVLDSAVDWKLATRNCPGGTEHFESLADCIDAAIEICVGVLGGYSGGRNV